MIVLDASAAVELLTEEGEIGSWVARTLEEEDAVGAPHLIDLEVLASLRKLIARGQLPQTRARDAVGAFGELRLTRYPVDDLVNRIWQLRHRLTPYDASYVVLAETLDVPLLTTDSRLARVGGHRARVVVYEP